MDNLRYFLLLFSISLFLFILFVVFVRGFPSYLDEEVYIGCGLRYISGEAPYLCNFEHPPFGKYFIGFSTLFGFSRYLFVFMGVAVVLLVYRVCLCISGSSFLGFLAGLFLVFDTLFLNVFRFLLLDPIAVFLFLLGFYMALCGRYFFSAVFHGLAIASKFSVAPLSLTSLYLVYRGRGSRYTLLYIFPMLAVYLSTYVADLFLGSGAILRHHLDMFGYLSWRHGFSIPIAINGLLKLLAKVEVWRFSGEFSITLTNISNSYVIDTVYTPLDGMYIVVGLGIGSILWYIHLPILLYTTYLTLIGRGSRGMDISTLLSWLSLANIATGPIDWYYVNVLPPLYINTVIGLNRMLGNRFRRVALALLTANAILVPATILGFIPYTVRLAV